MTGLNAPKLPDEVTVMSAHGAGSAWIDIRNPGELDSGVIAGAIPIPLAQLRTRVSQVPTDKPIVVHCAGGWCSSVAASLMRAQGFRDVCDLAGGYNQWAAAHSAA